MLRLSWDGTSAVSGTINAGPVRVGALTSGRFDPATSAISLAGEVTHPQTGKQMVFEANGTVDGTRIRVTYRMGDNTGTSVLQKFTLDYLARGVLAGLRH